MQKCVRICPYRSSSSSVHPLRNALQLRFVSEGGCYLFIRRWEWFWLRFAIHIIISMNSHYFWLWVDGGWQYSSHFKYTSSTVFLSSSLCVSMKDSQSSADSEGGCVLRKVNEMHISCGSFCLWELWTEEERDDKKEKSWWQINKMFQ